MNKASLVERIPLAASMALLMGAAMAFFVIAMPIELIERGVIASGLAGPPLGAGARVLIAGLAASISGALTWAAITLAGRMDRPRDGAEPIVEEGLPIHLHGGAYPESPTRPIFASELGSPDTPDCAVPEPEVLELVDIVAEGEAVADPTPLPIAALMARLEAGAERMAAKAIPVAPPPIAPAPRQASVDHGSLRNALDDLKKMATR